MPINLLKEVYDTALGILKVPAPIRRHVYLNMDDIYDLSEQMKHGGKVNFYEKEPQEFKDDDKLHVIVRELVASSINYCYWYGNEVIRPGNASSTTMYNLVDQAFQFFSPTDNEFAGHINDLIELLSLHRFPMLEERKRHLLELVEPAAYSEKDSKGMTFARYVKNFPSNEIVFDQLVKNFTGFASDTFLKRASLFMIQIYRQLGWYAPFMDKLFVPADYQLPKLLEAFGCMKYSLQLSSKIMEGRLIGKNSLMEVQLRAGTIVICKELCRLTKWNIADVDTWLWTKRKKFPMKKIHLTVTTDY